MIVSRNGTDSFKISQGELSLVFNPKSKTSADITLFSVGREETSEKSGFVISGPGEYEIKDIFIKGFLSEGPSSAKATAGGQARKINTIYLVSFEGMNLCFLGSLSNHELSADTLENFEDIDILFVPVDTLNPSSAYKLATTLEPSVIIPMYYTEATLKQFIKEGGEEKVESLDKFVVKKKDLEGKEGEIIVLKEE